MTGEKNNEKMLIRAYEIPEADGSRAYLPHPVLQATLFSIARDPLGRGRLSRQGGVATQFITRMGDEVKIQSARQLYCSPDLNTFVSVIALAQEAGIKQYLLEDKTIPVYFSTFGLSDLYTLMNVSSRNRQGILSSIEALGGTQITIRFADPSKYRNQTTWSSGTFWQADIITRRGRGGSIVELTLSPWLVPNGKYLYVDAVNLNKLKQDTAKGIYWALICRQHLSGTAEQWQEVLRSTDRNVWRFTNERFIPACKEMENKQGYTWAKNLNSRGEEVFTVRRYSTVRNAIKKSDPNGN